MKLYYHAGASSRAVHTTPRELGLPFELDFVDSAVATAIAAEKERLGGAVGGAG